MNYKQPHPSELLDKDIVSIIRLRALEAEQEGKLHSDQLLAIYENKWFKLFVLERCGGLSVSFPEALVIEEALSWADGSTGWVVTLCGGAGWFAGFINPDVVLELFTDPKLCIAGSGGSAGYADKHGDHYRISGRWPFASGAIHATAFTVNCIVREKGKPVYSKDGSPMVLSFILKKSEVTIIESWNMMGMIATGSHTFEVKEVLIPDNRSFTITPDKTFVSDPIYKFPFLPFAEATLAVNISGMACRFIDLAEAILAVQVANRSQAGNEMNHSKIKLMEARDKFFNCTLQSWEELLLNKAVSHNTSNNIGIVSRMLARTARECVGRLFPYCRLQAAIKNDEINRIWRNIHTAGQHSLLIN
jgi:indole-3-acetate monooxygenase